MLPLRVRRGLPAGPGRETVVGEREGLCSEEKRGGMMADGFVEGRVRVGVSGGDEEVGVVGEAGSLAVALANAARRAGVDGSCRSSEAGIVASSWLSSPLNSLSTPFKVVLPLSSCRCRRGFGLGLAGTEAIIFCSSASVTLILRRFN